MPRKQSSSTQKRAQGGGRNPNSEPRIQLFKDFTGVNFEHSLLYDPGVDASVDTLREQDGDQTDLQMTYLFLQNNVATASNKTLETREDLQSMFDAPEGVEFTGPACLIGNKLYLAKSDGNIGMADIDERLETSMPLVVDTDVPLLNKTESEHDWASFGYYDNKLIAMSEQGEMWTSDMRAYDAIELSNAIEIPDPQNDMFDWFRPRGSLVIAQSYVEACPFRVTIAFTYVNKYGPTKISPNTIVYVNHPPAEWNAGCYMAIIGTVPEGYDIEAVELYYATDNAMSMIFLGRADVMPSDSTWSFDWYGYVDATSMWTIANLMPPTENYTKGVKACRVQQIDGRLYFYGDPGNKQRLYIGGNPGNLLSVSPGTGGGFVDIEPGTGQAIRHVCKYKTQSGNSIVTMLCASPNTHRDQRYNLVENEISISNEQTMRSWQAEQVAGAVGCKSFDGAVVCQDGLYSICRYGVALTTLTMEYNSQIRTNYVSDPIKPVFTDVVVSESRLMNSILMELDGILYMALGSDSDQEGVIDNVIFCYDIDLKAWWTYTLDIDEPILNMFHMDWQGQWEGIGIVTKDHVYALSTTWRSYGHGDLGPQRFLIETSQLSTQMPQQGWQYLSQLEFHFDYFKGEAHIYVSMVDMFGRELVVHKHIQEDEETYDYVVRMRVDQRVMSYVIGMEGYARFRMTHFMARVYTMSNKIGQVWGFDDSISHRSAGSVRPTFRCYNDVRKAIFT